MNEFFYEMGWNLPLKTGGKHAGKQFDPALQHELTIKFPISKLVLVSI